MITKISGCIEYRYTMGFSVDGVPIPDPTAFSGKISDLDTLGKRDAKGVVHRKMVATKRKPQFEYTNIEWEMIQHICEQFKGKEFFDFTYPDPLYGLITIHGYVGDRDWTSVWNPETKVWIGTLKFNVIEE